MEEEKKVKLSTRILKALSIFLMVVFIIVLVIGFTTEPINYNIIITGFVGMFISSLLRNFAGTGVIEPKYISLSEIKCNNNDCGFQKYQKFEPGDYIYKILQKCKSCNTGAIFIQNIFQMEEKKAKKLIAGEELDK
ncbi:MAG: hypothetical protein EU549_04400 [Promethearchaeota archaeon]|nr:MAG: hypothetical protein EU549_04400 [Candidatus Lokiarchaeota archaeon]